MGQPPRSRRARLLDGSLLARSFGFLGLVESCAALALVPLGALLLLGWRWGTPLPRDGEALALLSTLVFAAIVSMQMVNAFACRSTSASMFRRPFSNQLLVGAVLVEMVILIAFIYQPSLQRLLGHRPLSVAQWGLVAAAPLTFVAAEELRKLLVRVRGAAQARTRSEASVAEPRRGETSR